MFDGMKCTLSQGGFTVRFLHAYIESCDYFISYLGPMGCLTGNYLLMKGDLESKDIVELMQETFRFIAEYKGEIPGAAPKDCGNYLLQDLPMAQWEAAKYLHEVLENITEENLNYPA